MESKHGEYNLQFPFDFRWKSHEFSSDQLGSLELFDNALRVKESRPYGYSKHFSEKHTSI